MTIEVEAPDGSIVEFPDGTAPDAMKGAMQKRFGVQKPAAADVSVADTMQPGVPTYAPPAKAPEPSTGLSKIAPLSQPWDLGSEVLNGMTFGTLPNLQAGIFAGAQGVKNAFGAGGPSMGETYDKELADTQNARRAYRKVFPITAAAGDAAGGLLTGGGLAKKGVTLVGREVAPAIADFFGGSKIVPKVAAGMAEGAGYSAAGGFGGGEGGFDRRLQNAEDNVPLGAIFGAASVPLAAGVNHVASMAANLYRGATDPAAHGVDMLIRSIMRDKQTPDMLAQKVEEAGAAGQPDFVAADAAGRNTQRLFKMAARTPGEMRNDTAQMLDARQGGQVERLQGYVDQATGNTGPNARQMERGITDARAKDADALYTQSYQAPAPQGPVYDEMLKRQSVQDAIGGVKKMAAENQTPLTDLFTEIPTPKDQQIVRQVPSKVLGPDGQPIMQTVVDNPTTEVPTMRGWDMVKRNLDTQVDSGFRSPDAQQRAAAQAVKETRDQLRGQLATDNPTYGKALEKYSDASGALDNIQAGRDLVKSPTDDAAKEAFEAVPEGQKDLARAGGAAEIKNKLDTKRSGADATMMFDNNAARSTLDNLAVDPTARAVLGNAGTAATRSGQLGREQAMAATRRLVGGGSDTVENLLEEPPPGIGQAIGLTMSGHPVRGAGMGFEVLRRAVSGLREEGTKAIGDALSSNDPNKIRALADLFNNAQQIAAQPSTAPAVLSAGFGAPRQRSNNRNATRVEIDVPKR